MSLKGFTVWNYRVIRKEHKSNQKNIENYVSYGVYEVYYKDGEPFSCSEEPNYVFGDSLEDLQEVLSMMMDALGRPVLDYETLKPVRS